MNLTERTIIEKVNPSHPDKLADRIGGAIVDLAYTKAREPKVAGEIMLGHGKCHILIESSETFDYDEINDIVLRIAGFVTLNLVVVPQDKHLADNQARSLKAGDNGIFKGVPLNEAEKTLSEYARAIYAIYPYDGKYVLQNYGKDNARLIICQSNVRTEELQLLMPSAEVNPLGDWTGGYNVDVGCCNRKLGSDMAHAVTGGGLHFKDLSKADVAVNIYAHIKAQETGEVVELACAIGDREVDGKPYEEIVRIAKEFIDDLGGFEKLAEWGLY